MNLLEKKLEPRMTMSTYDSIHSYKDLNVTIFPYVFLLLLPDIIFHSVLLIIYKSFDSYNVTIAVLTLIKLVGLTLWFYKYKKYNDINIKNESIDNKESLFTCLIYQNIQCLISLLIFLGTIYNIFSTKYKYVAIGEILFNLPLMVIFFIYYSIKLNSSESIEYYLPK